MKNLVLMILLLGSFFSLSQRSIPKNKQKPPHGKIKGFTYFSESDSTGFYVKNTEVTVGEYFEFVDWTINSIARRILAEEYPEKYLIPTFDSLGNLLDEENWKLNWRTKYSWDNPEYYDLLTSEIFYIENQRFYKPREFKPRLIRNIENSSSPSVIPLDFKYYLDGDLKKKKYREQIPIKTLNKPITNISFEQAQAYCEWKTKQLGLKKSKVQYNCSLPNLEHLNIYTGKNYSFCSNWLEVYPDELESKIEGANKEIIDSLYEVITTLEKSTNPNTSAIRAINRNIFDGFEEINETTYNPSLEKFNRTYSTTRNYYSYQNQIGLEGLKDNVSEWIDFPLPKNDSTLDKQLISYRSKNIFLGDFYYSTMVIGGNWWHSEDDCAKTYIDSETQLETIGFRYVMRVKN